MSVQALFNNPAAPEAAVSRARSDKAGRRETGATFALPEPTRSNRDAAPAEKERPAARSSAADDKRAEEAPPPKKNDVAAKDEPAAKPDEPKASTAPKAPAQNDAAATSEEVENADETDKVEQAAPLTGIDFLLAMAAAQLEAASGEAGAETDAEAGVGETAAEGEAGEGKAKEAAAATPQPVAVPVVPLPVQSGPVLDGAGMTADADGEALQQVAGDGTAQAAKTALALEGADKADGKAQAEPVGDAPKHAAHATSSSPADPKPFEMLLQQPVAKAEAGKLVQQLDPNSLMSGAAAAAGQGTTATGAPTPVHLVPIEIGLRAMSGAKQFDIRLDPAELGRVDVNLSISDSGEVSARLVVDRVETLHLLQRDARTLERAFEQAGLKPSDGGVDITLRDPSDQSAFRQNRQHDEAPQRSRQQHGADAGDDASLSIDPVPQRRLVRLGGVDLSI
ncbi:flagellar hook-length control protein FliK [Bosea sp. BH3]|uniref:flagellar hook-length control protein FliK n=1 Tax=Bosea sp. BH3 TaxID=2871701 RepID=UPI0021CB163D|nr:flagellar hook-length control protein FliK [Bosea sp. BH3]MCU4181074.1 flagellar hook-length control protein FliK [Bosea sp. BH3]